MLPTLGLMIVTAFTTPWLTNAEQVVDACHTGLTIGDTARFVGLTRNHRSAGEMRLWADSPNRFRYSESWRSGSSNYVWDGEVDVGADAAPRRLVWRSQVDGAVRSTLTVERVGDSVIMVRGEQRSAERLPTGAFRISSFRPAAVIAILAQCTLARPRDGLATSRFGVLRVRKASTIQLRVTRRTKTISLYAIASDSVPDVDRLWLDSNGRLFAYPNVEGVMFVLQPEWTAGMDQLVAAEVHAAEPRMRQTVEDLSVRPATGIVFVHARVLDVERGRSSEGVSVVVRGSRIIAIGPDSKIHPPRGAMIVDASGKTLMPGLWDLGRGGINGSWGAATDQPTRNLLSRGVTGVQEIGGDTLFSPQIVRRLANHKQLGPRLFAACSLHGWIPDTLDGAVPRFREQHGQVRDSSDLRRIVNRCSEIGMNQLNLNMTFPAELLPTAVAQAHAKGVKVSGEALRNATARELIFAGYDGFTHVGQTLFPFASIDSSRADWLLGRIGGMASFWYSGQGLSQLDLDSPPVREVMNLLVQRRLPMLTTLCVYPPVNRFTRAHDTTWDAASLAKLREYVARLHREGAALGVGTDGACSVAKELELLQEIGFTDAELIKMATLGAARFVGRDRDLGSIEVGKLADMILVDGDPLANLSDLERVTIVMQNGYLYTDLPALRAELPFLPREAANRRF